MGTAVSKHKFATSAVVRHFTITVSFNHTQLINSTHYFT